MRNLKIWKYVCEKGCQAENAAEDVSQNKLPFHPHNAKMIVSVRVNTFWLWPIFSWWVISGRETEKWECFWTQIMQHFRRLWMQEFMWIKAVWFSTPTVFWRPQMLLYAIVVRDVSENLLQRICLRHIIAKAVIRKRCLLALQSAKRRISKHIWTGMMSFIWIFNGA